jgi:hypothetical protein
MPESLALASASWLDGSVTAPPLLSHVPRWVPATVMPWLHRVGALAGGWVQAVARHSGIPAVLVAALGLVLAFRLARRALHLVVEVALALALVLAATKAGWIRF